jgi:hypothetical protein
MGLTRIYLQYNVLLEGFDMERKGGVQGGGERWNGEMSILFGRTI